MASGDGMVYASELSWRPSCQGGMGSPFGGHYRQRNSYRTPSPDFSCQLVLCAAFFGVLNVPDGVV